MREKSILFHFTDFFSKIKICLWKRTRKLKDLHMYMFVYVIEEHTCMLEMTMLRNTYIWLFSFYSFMCLLELNIPDL